MKKARTPRRRGSSLPLRRTRGHGDGARASSDDRKVPSFTSDRHNRREFLCQLPLAALSTAYVAGGRQALSPRQQKRKLSNGYFDVRFDGERITSLRADGNGRGKYGAETIASGGVIAGSISAHLDKERLILETRKGEFSWDLPFDRKGYYDAETHLNYPSPYSTKGVYPLALPFRKFVTSAGQVVFIESFKRLPLGPYFLNFVIARGSQMLFCGDRQQNFDLKVCWPEQRVVDYKIAEDRLTFLTKTVGKPVIIEVLPRGLEDVPSNLLIHPKVTFDPDPEITYLPTGKSLPASDLMTDLMRFGIHWSPKVVVTGDWGLSAAEMHRINDPRSWHLQRLRSELLNYMGFIGYDRFEHFGCMFAWGRFPDYGAGGLLNLPPFNAPYDMRTLHLNGQWIQTITSFVLATRDTSFLRARRARWVATDGNEPQPICGRKSWVQDYVLAAGDVRLDGRLPREVHTLGQTFVATAAFSEIRVRLGTDGKEVARGVISLRSEPSGTLLEQKDFTLEPGHRSQSVILRLSKQRTAGKYFVEISDSDSGRRYFGPGIYWWTDPETKYLGGEATSGPFQGTIHDRLKLLFQYIQKYCGAAEGNLAQYINNREYNVPNYKSGLSNLCTENSYWELPGGGYDAFEGLWYNAACNALAELAEFEDDADSAARYRLLFRKANEAYNKKYWHSVTENGKEISRYHACEDWDGKTHDYGFTYYNLEAAFRGIPSLQQVRSVLWWLDRGYWSRDGGAPPGFARPWKENMYSIWEVAPPFNSIGNTTWLNVTGTLPYLEVVANGGSRCFIGGRDLVVRSNYLSVDNMHERNKRILARFANPDRLTGGRTFNDPGGRGRWFFGEPFVDIADFEAFHEIFPQEGVLPASEPLAYLGMEYAAKGLWLRPRVPSELNLMKFEGIGYAEAVFDFQVQAERKRVPLSASEDENQLSATFVPHSRFNKVGVLTAVRPPGVHQGCQISLTLEHWTPTGWAEVDRTWFSDVADRKWVWLATERWLEPSERYRLTVHDFRAPGGEICGIKLTRQGRPLIDVQQETNILIVHCRYNPRKRRFILRSEADEVLPSLPLTSTLDPGQRILLSAQF